MVKLIKQKDGVYYYDKLPDWAREKYYCAVNGVCQLCHKKMKFNEMHIHRLKRGCKGGFYTLCPINHKAQNCMLVHHDCHKRLHEGEPQRR